MAVKRLYRSRKDQMIAGVCGGIAEYFDLDPALVRLAFVLLLFAGGAGVLLYVAGMIIIPENPHQKPRKQENIEEKLEKIGKTIEEKAEALGEEISDNTTTGRTSKLLGGILLAVGLWFVFRSFLPAWFAMGNLWPLLLIGLGILLIARRN